MGRHLLRVGCVLALVLTACSSYERVPPADHVVAAPVSKRANAVLRNLVEMYGSSDGRWRGCMSPGCTPIWAVQFGYRAGVRRDRDDVVAIGKATARRESSEIRGLFWDALFGDVDENDPAVFGFPALLVSGTLGGRGIDAWLFSTGLDRIGETRKPGSLRPRENAGLAALLAEVSRIEPDRREERLELARGFAGGTAGDPVLAFFARASVARASGETADVERAREAEHATCYRFDANGTLSPIPNGDEILSLHLAMIHGFADLAQATGDPATRQKAVVLLDYVFSDAYFDGRFLVHDRLSGEPSKDVCSGCDFMALYLVDRLWGDSFVIDPVPALPDRDWPEESRKRTIDETLVLEGTEAEFTLESLDHHGLLLFTRENHDIRITCEYRVRPLEEIEPRGGVEMIVVVRGAEARFKSKRTFLIPFDETGAADIRHVHGFRPLAYHVRFEKRGEDLAATVRLLEGQP
jgi:hypothetical protein